MRSQQHRGWALSKNDTWYIISAANEVAPAQMFRRGGPPMWASLPSALSQSIMFVRLVWNWPRAADADSLLSESWTRVCVHVQTGRGQGRRFEQGAAEHQATAGGDGGGEEAAGGGDGSGNIHPPVSLASLSSAFRSWRRLTFDFFCLQIAAFCNNLKKKIN